jgi:hypothetical protein
MHYKWFKRLVFFLYAVVLYCGWASLDVLVSLQYETAGKNDCISTITGYNLCFQLTCIKLIAAFCFLTATCLLFSEKRVVKKY